MYGIIFSLLITLSATAKDLTPELKEKLSNHFQQYVLAQKEAHKKYYDFMYTSERESIERQKKIRDEYLQKIFAEFDAQNVHQRKETQKSRSRIQKLKSEMRKKVREAEQQGLKELRTERKTFNKTTREARRKLSEFKREIQKANNMQQR